MSGSSPIKKALRLVVIAEFFGENHVSSRTTVPEIYGIWKNLGPSSL
jgi:hypothetical protein